MEYALPDRISSYNKEIAANMSTLGERIKQARQEAGLTQPDLAAKVGVTKGAISSLERGTSKNIRQDNLFAVAKATGFNPQWIATGKGPEKGDLNSDGDLPEIEIEVAGAWAHLNEPYLDDFQLTVPAPRVGEVGPRAYVLQVKDGALTPLIPSGLKVVIDPDAEPEQGKVAVFHLPEYKETYIGIYIKRTGKESLKFMDGSDPVPLDGALYCGKARILLAKEL